jgi:flagellar motor switch protein FliN
MGDSNKMKSTAAKSGQGSPAAASGTPGGGSADKPAAKKSNMDFILDIPLEISVELGRTTLMINDLLKLGQGSVVELSKIAGETLEVLANQRLIARGEVVVINEKYGIRLTEIISPMERIERLR